MVTKVFAIQDVKSEMFHTPFFYPHNGQALRAFTELVRDGQSMVSKYPGDFKLVWIGTFDDASGKLVASDMVTLGFGTDFVASDTVVPLSKVS